MSDDNDSIKGQLILAGVIALGALIYAAPMILGRPLLPSWRSLGGPPPGSVLEPGETRGAAPLAAPARVEINGVPAQQSIHVVNDSEPEFLQERRATPQGDMRVPGTPQSASNPTLAPKIFARPEISQDSLALQRERKPESERENAIIFFIKRNPQICVALLAIVFILGWIVWAKVTAAPAQLEPTKAPPPQDPPKA